MIPYKKLLNRFMLHTSTIPTFSILGKRREKNGKKWERDQVCCLKEPEQVKAKQKHLEYFLSS